LRLRPTLNLLRDLAPLVAQLQPQIQELQVFLDGPLRLLNVGIKSCEPPLSTLLAVSLDESVRRLLALWKSINVALDLIVEHPRYAPPVFGSVAYYYLLKYLIFFCSPLSFISP